MPRNVIGVAVLGKIVRNIEISPFGGESVRVKARLMTSLRSRIGIR